MPVLANRPVIRKAARAAVEAVVDAVRERRQGPVTAAVNEATVTAAANNIAEQPALVNALNAEPWWESRIKLGTLVLAVTMVARWIGVELPAISDADMEIIYNVLITFGGGLAAIGRWVGNLKPINWRRPWTLFGIGR
jgi:hypothetical protein